MIERNVPRDITKYETKLIGPLTTRQLICGTLGLGLAVAAYFLLKDFAGESALFVSVVLGLPFLLAGWWKPYGMHLEKYVIDVLAKNLLAPNKRKYKTKNTDDDLLEENIKFVHFKQKKNKYYSKNPELKPLK